MKIDVIVTTYNHEKYIAQCLDGVLKQKGDFQIEVVVGDDCSTDNTQKIITKFRERYPKIIFVLPTEINLGITKNLKRCLDACSGDYIAICEGDDYWTDEYKLQKQMTFLETHQDFSMCFSALMIYYEDLNVSEPFQSQQLLSKDILSTEDLILENSIGNFSCCMYRTSVVRKFPDKLFNLFTVDWMFNMVSGQFGKIGFIRDRMSVYRKHKHGTWTSLSDIEKLTELSRLIDEYNKFFNYKYDIEFSKKKKDVEAAYPDGFYRAPVELAIIDDIFPHPLSAFRIQEFVSYLKEFENLKIYSSGSSVHILGTKSLGELFAGFKGKYPEYASNIEVLQPNTIINTKLIYMVFLGNAYLYIDRIEQAKVPFVFTLYPGGRFGINDPSSDMMLQRVTSSPCFRKVIVTQKVTYDYLIKKQFCRPDQIEFIFGVVTPIDQIETEYTDKNHFGIDKNTLDICFAAYKYTVKGIDKGYDVFIDVAKELCKKYDNIRFHVVGGFDEHVIDVSDIKDRIVFYGKRDIEWFDQFYKDKDIILSPNAPSMLFNGAFDGFPTGSCVDAGVRKTALFCTDELNLNTQFVEGEEIVIIPHDASQIVSIIEDYYRNPQKLKALAENGCRRIKEVYSFEAQILPRINILKKELENTESTKMVVFKDEAQSFQKAENSKVKLNFGQRLKQLMISTLITVKRISPLWLKKLLRKTYQEIRSNEALFGFIKRLTPDFMIRIYSKLRSL